MIKTILINMVFVTAVTVTAQAQNVRVGECPENDCTNSKNTQIVVEEVTKVRDRDVKSGLCIKHKATGQETRFERKDDTFAVTLTFDEDENVIELDEMMLIRDEYHDLLAESVPVPCDQTIFGDEEYLSACKNGADKWPRVSYCLDRKTLRKQKMYGLE